jgi:CRP-like cAMP-binding protein
MDTLEHTTDDHRSIGSMFDDLPLETAKANTLLVPPDERPKYLYLLHVGYVRMYSILENGTEFTVNILRSDSLFPMMSVIDDKPNRYYYRTMSPVTYTRIPISKVSAAMAQDPRMMNVLLQRMVRGMSGLIVNMEYLLTGKADRRIAAALSILAKRFGRTDPNGTIHIDVPIPHAVIATLAGVTRETASIVLKGFKDRELISYRNRRIVVLSPQRLFSGEDLQESNVDMA